jgi:hypothetical protein
MPFHLLLLPQDDRYVEYLWSEGSKWKVPKKVISGLCFAAISEIITEMRRLANTLIVWQCFGPLDRYGLDEVGRL